MINPSIVHFATPGTTKIRIALVDLAGNGELDRVNDQLQVMLAGRPVDMERTVRTSTD